MGYGNTANLYGMLIIWCTSYDVVLILYFIDFVFHLLFSTTFGLGSQRK